MIEFGTCSLCGGRVTVRGFRSGTRSLPVCRDCGAEATSRDPVIEMRKGTSGMGYPSQAPAPKGGPAIPAPITADPRTWPPAWGLEGRATDSESPHPDHVSISTVCTCRWCRTVGYAAGYVPPAAGPDPAPPSGTRAGGVAAAGGATTTDASGHTKILP